MNNLNSAASATPHVIWVCPGSLASMLYAAQHLDTAQELRKMGWRVTLISADSAQLRSIRGVETLCIPMPETYFARQLIFHIKVLRLILRQAMPPDVILFHQNSVPWFLPLRFLRRLIGRSRMLLVMDIRTVHMPPKSKEGMKGKMRRAFLKSMSWLANRWADGQTAITPRMAEALKIPSQKLLGTWPSGVTLDRFAFAQTSRHWPLEEEPIKLIYIGTLHYERNLMKLCEAVVQANSAGMAFSLTLIGDGTERADLETFASKTEGKVRVLAPIPHDQVPELLALAQVGVLPFPDEEKFRVSSPIKLFEYMASGLPILATRITCHTDVVCDGKYVFWAEDATTMGLIAALRQLWCERGSLSMMSREAAKAAQAWTWTEAAKKLKTALEKGMSKVGDKRKVPIKPLLSECE
jgi:glycosyltransferase involved in cell wall biosynthesis